MAKAVKNSKNPDSVKGSFVITQGCRLSAPMVNINSDMHVSGEIIGDIFSTASIIIGKHGIVKGDVSCMDLIVSGMLEGGAKCSEINIFPSGKIYGEIKSEKITIAIGGVYEGKISIQSTKKE